MNRKETEMFIEELKLYMEKQALQLGMQKGTGVDFVKQYIEVYPDEMPMMGMIDMRDKRSVSVKPGNVLINQKGILLAACVDWITSFAIPDKVLNYIQLCLLTGLAIYSSMKVELDENESYVVAYLHSHQMYNRGEIERIFYINFPIWFKQQTGDEISEKRLKKAVETLLLIKSIKFEEGEIKLKEKVWWNR